MKYFTFKQSFLIGLIVNVNIVFAQYNAPLNPKHQATDEYLYCARAKNNTVQTSTNIPPDGVNTSVIKKNKGTCQYSTNAELAGLSASQLITYLKSSSDYSCHARILFNYEDAYSPTIFSNSNMQAVANEIKNIAPSYDGTYANGIYGLICYLHVATYFNFYHAAAVPINQTLWDAIIQATNAVCINSHMFDLNLDAATILEEFLIDLDLPGVRSQPTTISFVKQVMENMVVDKTWQTVSDTKLVSGYWRIFFLMFRGAQDSDYINVIKNDNEYINLWGSIATDTAIMNNPDFNFWLDNAILELSRVSKDTALKDKVIPYLAEICETSPRLSKNWLNATNAINDAGECATYNLCENKDTLQQELMNELFPNTYSYNDGALVFRAKFGRDVADNLYYATQQTRAQLYRLIETDQPVTGDTNKRLTAIVFDSKATYDSYAGYLYGIATNNGGMYLEQPAQFYTWDRPSTYSLSLEELFRHEFNHYLQGRYLIPGLWGQTPFYTNDCLTWFEEGSAELWCASTDYYGIRIKPSTINTLKSDYPNCPTLKEVLTSYYGMSNAIYYPYGNLVWFNWYKNYYGLIKRLTDLTRSNNVSGFDALVDSLKNSAAAETQWKSFLTDMKNGVIEPWQPTTNWIDDKGLTIGTIDDIKTEFTGITGISAVTVTKDADALIKRFKLAGHIAGQGKVYNATNAAKTMNTALDSLLLILKNDPVISNFDYTVGYVKNITVTNNVAESDFCILGSLRDSTISEAPIASFTSDNNTTITDGTINFASTSTGYIKGFEWTFPGGTPSSSSIADPAVVYTKAGLYPVTLKVIGKSSSITDTKTITQYIKVYESSPTTYCTATFTNDYSWISHVQLAAIDNDNRSFTPTGYADYTKSHITELIKDSAYPITIDLSYVNSPTVKIGVWIDLNQNGLFTDAGEELILTQLKQQYQLSDATITIPALANNGVTRMRIRATYDGTIDPCGNNGYMGETEDYSVVIRSLTIDTIAPSTPDELSVSDITATSCLLSWKAASDNKKLAGYVIYKDGVAFKTVTDTFVSISGLMASTGYTFTCKAKDADVNYSDVSNKVSMITLFSQSAGGIYLSYLTETSSTIGWGTLQKDRSIGENPIKLNNTTYLKGLGIHANSEQVYDLNGGYIRFLADVGVDDEVGDGGASTVVFMVYKDNVLAYTSPLMTPTTATEKIDLDVTGTMTLKIVVTDGGDGMNSDHADWADARLTPKASQILMLSETELFMLATDKSTATFDITSNTSWNIVSNQNWLVVNTASDSGNASITATATENLADSNRTALLTISGNGISTKTIQVIQSAYTTDINKQLSIHAVDIFPNPTNGKFILQLNKELRGDVTLTIFNAMGSYSQLYHIYKSADTMLQEISLEPISKGIYFIAISTDKVKVVKKIVVE